MDAEEKPLDICKCKCNETSEVKHTFLRGTSCSICEPSSKHSVVIRTEEKPFDLCDHETHATGQSPMTPCGITCPICKACVKHNLMEVHCKRAHQARFSQLGVDAFAEAKKIDDLMKRSQK